MWCPWFPEATPFHFGTFPTTCTDRALASAATARDIPQRSRLSHGFCRWWRCCSRWQPRNTSGMLSASVNCDQICYDMFRSENIIEIPWKIIGLTAFRYVQILKVIGNSLEGSEMVGGPERTSVCQDQKARRVDELHLCDSYTTPTYKVVPSAVCYCLLSHLTAVWYIYQPPDALTTCCRNIVYSYSQLHLACDDITWHNHKL